MAEHFDRLLLIWRMMVLFFSSTVFLFLFLPLTILIYYNPIWKGRRFRNYFLLFASLLFYAYGAPLFVFLMIMAIVARGGYRSKGWPVRVQKTEKTLAGIWMYWTGFYAFCI